MSLLGVVSIQQAVVFPIDVSESFIMFKVSEYDLDSEVKLYLLCAPQNHFIGKNWSLYPVLYTLKRHKSAYEWAVVRLYSINHVMLE